MEFCIHLKKAKSTSLCSEKAARELPEPQSFETNLMVAIDPGLTMHILKPNAEIAGISQEVLDKPLHSDG
jgi:hypothetical protein